MMKIGSRNIKTAISVFICICIFQLLNRPYPFYACIAAVICMKNSIQNSFVVGKNRMIGTTIGGVIGLILALVFGNYSIVVGLGIVLVIYLCNLCKQSDSIVIACIVFIAIMTNLKGTPSHIYAVNRVIDTFIGIIVSIIVNVFPKIKDVRKKA
ncbi:FUSC family protein [Vallitalea guaymasensis]|uniref:Aromatic acid exporter family protein n=1 Tax=Vallitalea guaymasensis TaxID=1185412 RepID=A0A8J8SAT7_9FIRM|nr:aromatic acid exporter family protein [Vallitalea guaymasensis]QUH27924.1 aromatic acid exporter family protein [Vallitalea guaymasensis]